MASSSAPANVQNPPAPVEQSKDAKKKVSLKKNVNMVDFGGPSRPKSGYFLFSDEKRPSVMDKIKSSGQVFNVRLVGSTLGDMWKALSDAEKEPYNKKATELKAQYEKDLEAFKNSDAYKKYVHDDALHRKKKADKKAVVAAKESGMPKKPLSGYMLFQMDVRDECVKEAGTGSVKVLGPIVKTKWDALGDEKKAEYNEKYVVNKKKYEEDYAAWLETDAGKIFTKAKDGNAKRKRANEKAGNKEAKRAKSDGKKKTQNEPQAEESPEEEEDEELDLSEDESGEQAAAEE